jgi:hypothetical protein
MARAAFLNSLLIEIQQKATLLLEHGYPMNILSEKSSDWKGKIRHELIRYWLIVLYLAFFFGGFANYRRLILAQYDISYQDYGISMIEALVLAKVIVVAEKLGLGRGFEGKRLIIPTLYKGFLFSVCAGLFNVVESMIRSFISGKDPAGAVDDVINQFNYELFAGGLVVFLAFIPFFAIRELNSVLGKGTLFKLFFQRRSIMKASYDETKNRRKNDDSPSNLS